MGQRKVSKGNNANVEEDEGALVEEGQEQNKFNRSKNKAAKTDD